MEGRKRFFFARYSWYRSSHTERRNSEKYLGTSMAGIDFRPGRTFSRRTMVYQPLVPVQRISLSLSLFLSSDACICTLCVCTLLTSAFLTFSFSYKAPIRGHLRAACTDLLLFSPPSPLSSSFLLSLSLSLDVELPFGSGISLSFLPTIYIYTVSRYFVARNRWRIIIEESFVKRRRGCFWNEKVFFFEINFEFFSLLKKKRRNESLKTCPQIFFLRATRVRIIKFRFHKGGGNPTIHAYFPMIEKERERERKTRTREFSFNVFNRHLMKTRGIWNPLPFKLPHNCGGKNRIAYINWPRAG